MSDSKVKVLFIAGAGRSGSTLLHNILGQLEGYVAIGEIREIWRRSVLENWVCGCGAPFHECGFWNQVIESAFGGIDNVDARHLANLTDRFRTRDLPATLFPPTRRRLLAQFDDLLTALEELFVAVQRVSGSRVIIDSTKNPSFGYLLHAVARFQVFDLHLVRHPAAVAYSWRRREDWSPARSARRWLARNLGVERFIRPHSRHYAALRYEDFIADPGPWLDAITGWLAEPVSSNPLTGEGAVDFAHPDHSVYGNPSRLQHGIVRLRRDDQWLTEMHRSDLRQVGMIARPLLRKYGYGMRPPMVRSHSQLPRPPWTKPTAP